MNLPSPFEVLIQTLESFRNHNGTRNGNVNPSFSHIFSCQTQSKPQLAVLSRRARRQNTHFGVVRQRERMASKNTTSTKV